MDDGRSTDRADVASLAQFRSERCQTDLAAKAVCRPPRWAGQSEPAHAQQIARSERSRGLRQTLIEAHEESFGTRRSSRDLLVGLQLTHSGRFARPNSKSQLEPKIVYHHPLLDRKFGITARRMTA
jgi:hypothetical protein